MTDPDSTKFTSGYTYKRWASFAEPPIQNLAKISIPIYQVHGTKDESTPIESAYIVPLEFARLKKDNLTLKFYANADHSLIERKSDGTEVFHWNDMMVNFFKWVAQNPIRTTANKGLVK
jgi:pimeloyl-ACP methyl ester carboxylesterase